MAALSRRERKEVRSEIRRALRPDIKLFQTDIASAFITSTAGGAGTDLFGGIVPGVGEGNRLGDTIRVRRVEVWVAWAAPARPWTRNPVAGDLFWRSTVPVGGTLPGSSAAFYDPFLAAGAEYLRGPAPPLLDCAERGWHWRHLGKHKLRGCPELNCVGYNTALGAQSDIGIPNYNETATTSGTGGPYFTTTYGFGAANNMLGGVAEPGVISRQAEGMVTSVRKYHWTFPGKGLRVEFANAGLATVDQNHLVWIRTSTIIPGSANSQCPSARGSVRIWFTEND